MDLETVNVRRFLEDAVSEAPDNPFLIWTPDGSEVTYRDFNKRVDKAARAWYSLGVQKGDRVAFMLDNCPDFVYAWLGLAKIGGVLVAINTGFRSEEARYLLVDSGARLALTGERYCGLFEELAGAVPELAKVLTVGRVDGYESFDDVAAAAEPVAPDVELRGDDLISLIYTSGTTGNPKGVMQTHRNFVLTGQAYPYWMAMARGDRVYACLPLFHINSQAYSTMGAIGARGSLVLAPRFSASRFWPDLRRHHVTVFNFIGAMTVILSKKQLEPDDHDNDVKVAYGVPALAHDVRLAIEERFGLKVISGFGMSETTFGLLEPLEGERRPGSMGIPRHHPEPSVPKTQARIVDDDGNDVPVRATGELLLKNAAMMTGYFGDPERTKAALVDGWLHTGDSAWQDEDGYFYFVDRRKDIVRRRGENISSLEVERVVQEHPSVMEAAVVGVPSEMTDEDVLVYVVLRPSAAVDPAEIVEWCRDRLAPFKVPRYVEFIDALPKTETSKVQKARLRGLEPGTAGGRYDAEAGAALT